MFALIGKALLQALPVGTGIDFFMALNGLPDHAFPGIVR
jgi:hypothetical protein